jgi:CDP-glucose 4,6-dehydratase
MGQRQSAMEGVGVTGFWQGRTTFITGAHGMLGQWLMRRLAQQGADIICLTRHQPDIFDHSTKTFSNAPQNVPKIVCGDICDRALLERILSEYEVNTVFHLAAQSIVPIANAEPRPTFETNIGGTWTLLEACRRNPQVEQIVLASSDKAYGQHDTVPYHEGMPLQARHPYEASKACADLLAQTYAHTYNIPVAITRCGNFYGGGDLNWNRIVPGTIRSTLRGERPVIRSDGQYVRDYLYVEDGAAAYTLLAEKLASNPKIAGQAFNFSNEMPVTVVDIVERILKLMNSNLKPEIRNEASNEIRHQYLSSAKAKSVLGWQSEYSLDEGLQRTIEWYTKYWKETA